MPGPTRRQLLGLITGTSATVALAACGASSSTGTAASAKPKTVGATLLSLEYPFLVTLNDTMKQEAATEGLNLISLDPRQKTATELSQIEDLVTKNVDVVVMIPVDQKASQVAAGRVNEAKIPLILVNTRFSDDFKGDYVSYVGSDDSEAGKIEGDYLAKQLPDGGNVVYLITQYGGASTERRKQGFDTAIASHASLKVVTEVEAHGSRAEAKSIMENLLQRYKNAGDVQAVVAQNDEMAIGAASAIAEAKRQSEFKVIVGVDGSAAGLKAVNDGSITATVFQDAKGQGKTAMDTAAKVASGQTVEKNIIIPFQLVTKDNLSSFQ